MKGTYTTYKSWLTAAKKAGAVRLDGDKDIAMAFGSDGRGVAEWDGAEGYVYKVKSMIDGKMIFENPKGVYTTYGAWRAAAKKAGAMRFEGDKDIAQAFDGNGRPVAEWDGAEGYVYKVKSMIDGKMIFTNPVKSRRENYRNFDEWETDAFRAGATQVVRIGEYIYSAIKMNDGSLVKLDEEGFVDMRSRAGQKVRKESILVGSWYGNNGEIYRQMIRNNPVKQRIGISLSKNRKRNPLESGATISDDEDINNQASNMG